MRIAILVCLYLGLPVLGTYLMFRPTFDSHFQSMQTDYGDTLFNHYILENSWLAISDSSYCGTLLSPPFYFPEKYMIYYSETLFGVAPLYWGLRLVLPYDLAYAWWQILLNLLNFFVFAMVARWWKWPHLLALGGAFMWAFAMVHAEQLKHQQMIGRFWMPLGVYYAVAVVLEPSTRSLHRLLGSIYLQSLACVYCGWFLAAGLAVFMPALFALRYGSWSTFKQFARINRRELIRILLLWGGAFLLLFVPYVLVNWGVSREYSETYGLVPTPSSWITGPPGSIWNEATKPYCEPVSPECLLFCGFTIYLLMLGSLLCLARFRRNDPAPERSIILAAMITVLAWFAFTLTTHDGGDSLWLVVRYLPGGMAIRCVGRVYLVIYLFGSIAGLMWLAHATKHFRSEWLRMLVHALVISAMIAEQGDYQLGSFKRKNFYPLVEEAADRLRGAETGWVVPRYVDSDGTIHEGVDGEIFAMWVGLRANVSVVNGYSGRLPNGFPSLGGLTYYWIPDWLEGNYRGRVRIIDPLASRDLPVQEIEIK